MYFSPLGLSNAVFVLLSGDGVCWFWALLTFFPCQRWCSALALGLLICQVVFDALPVKKKKPLACIWLFKEFIRLFLP